MDKLKELAAKALEKAKELPKKILDYLWEDCCKALYKKLKEKMNRELAIKLGLCAAVAIAARHIPALAPDLARDALIAAAGVWGVGPACNQICRALKWAEKLLKRKK